MAKVKNNIVIEGLSGSLGNRIVFSQRAGKTVVSVKPQPSAPKSEAQLRQMQTFKEATFYAKKVIKDPVTKAAYAQRAKPGQSAYSVAISDYMTAPDISLVDFSLYDGKKGSPLTIRASDDHMVTEVQVAIYDANGVLLEEGSATPEENGLDWTYTTQKATTEVQGNRLEIKATDLPGNRSQRSEVVA